MLITIRTTLALIAFGVLCACQTTGTTGLSANERRIAQTEENISTCIAATCDRLNIDSGQLNDFSVLGDLTHVAALRMSWTDFSDLGDITAMTQLRELHLQWSRNVEDFSPITQIPSLKELALGGNDMGDMAFVAELRDLDGLSLINGSVTSLEALRNHPNLSRLDLRRADLPADISALLSIPNLKMVSVSVGVQTDAQQSVFDELKSRGVEVDEIIDPVVVIC